MKKYYGYRKRIFLHSTDFTQILSHFASIALCSNILFYTKKKSWWNYICISMKLNQSVWFFFAHIHTFLMISIARHKCNYFIVCIVDFFLYHFYFIVCLDPTRFHVILQSSHEGDCRNKTGKERNNAKVAHEKRGRNILKQARQQR